MSNPDLQQTAQIAAQLQQPVSLTDNDLKHHSQELGLLGYIFGSRANAPVYIAALAIVFSFVIICCVLAFAQESDGLSKTQMVGLFIPIITGALGYLFGKGAN
jgi:hypothetical protein